jgi:multicomponent K+:H+ antiporter subunit A
LLIGVVWLKSMAGALDFTSSGVLASLPDLPTRELIIIFALLMTGLGVKAALVPLHGWLPVAMAAPAPVSALLHAVAVVKAGAFGIVRVIYDVYGVEFSSSLGVTTFLAFAAAITIVYASVRALYQDDLKKRLAYSTVSQVSYIALGAALAGPMATIGGIVHLVHQGLMKITLFFCAGNIAETTGVHKISQMDGLGKRMPVTMTAFTLAAFGMIGIPPFAGFVSKWYLGIGAIEAQAYWVLLVLAASSALNAMYLLPIVYRVWFKPAVSTSVKKVTTKDANWMMLLPPVLTVSLALAAGLLANSQFSPLYWAKLIAQQEYPSLLISNTLPVSGEHLMLGILVVIPLLLALTILLPRVGTKLSSLTPLAAIPALLASMFLNAQQTQASWLFFGSEFSIDETSRLMMFLAASLWLICGVYSLIYLSAGKPRKLFFCYFNLAMSGSFGLILSQDLFGFITFFTLMSLASYGLILHDKTLQARIAGTSYIRWVITGEILLFTAFCLLYGLYDHTPLKPTGYHTALSLVLMGGFGIKMGLLGLHFWLPKAHPAAPIPASAILSGLMVKSGLIGMIKFMPSEPSYDLVTANSLIVVGLTGTFVAILLGMMQRNPKALLAYSTVSQMGLLAASFGIFMHQPSDWMLLAIVFYCLHHGFAKAALFLSIGTIPLMAGSTLQRAAGIGLIILPALAIVGLPFLSGGFAKTLLKSTWQDYIMLSTMLSISAIGSTLLMLKLLYLARQIALTSELPSAKHKKLILPIGATLAVMLALPFIFHDIPGKSLPSWQNITALTWPIILGISTWILLRKVKLENDMFGRFSQFSDHCKDFFQDQRQEQNQGKSQATQSFFNKMTEHNYINIWSNKNRTVVTWHNKLMSWHINQSIIIVGLAMVLAATLYWG